MDDPMIRSRLGRVTGTRPIGALDPKREPHIIFARLSFSVRTSALPLSQFIRPAVVLESAR
jgi:hypothetical protein